MPVTRSVGKGRKPTSEIMPSSSTGTATTTETTATETTAGTSATRTTTETTATGTTAETSATGATTETETSVTRSTATRASVAKSAATEATGTTAKPLVDPTVQRGMATTSHTDAPQYSVPPPKPRRDDVPTERRAKQKDACLPDPAKQPEQNDGNKRTGSVKSRTKALKIARAKEELARLQVELATARLATLEMAETDEEDDDVSVYSRAETNARVNTWLNSQAEPAMPAATNEPQQPTLEQVTAVEDHKEEREAPPATQPPQQAPAGACAHPVVQPDFSQLASAITLAVKAAQQPRVIELPTFNGYHQDWLHFRAAYHETEKMFTDTENMNRLRRNLKGRAREAVEGLLITNADPREVMKTLETRFGRPESIAMVEIDTLRALPRLNESPRDICIFSSKVTNAVSTLRALNCIYYLYNPEVARAMVEKLNPTLRYRYYDFAAAQPREEPELLKLDKFLKREADLCGPYAQPEQVSSYSQPTQQKRPQKVHITTEKTSTARCPVCEEAGHTTTDCEKFKKADENLRWDIAKNRRLCFRCLRHRSKTHSCRPKNCGINSCKYYHHKMLHFTRTTEKADNSNEDQQKGSTEAINSAWTTRRKQSFLKIIPVRVSGPAGAVETFALLDDGSTVTLIDDSIANSIGATGPIDPLRIEAINEMKTAETKSRRVNFAIKGVNDRVERIQARTVKNLHVSTQEVSREQIERCKHLRDICDVVTYENAKPGILIGQDNWHLLLTSKVRRGNRNQPVASLTPLGWVLHGSHTRTLGRNVDFVSHVTEAQKENLEDMMKQYFAMDALCINPKKPKSDPEEQALRILTENTVHSETGRYETALLWKKEDITLPDNYENSLKRLFSIEKKLDRDPRLKEKYTEQMEALTTKGYAEPAPKTKTENRTWYLPHFAVINPMKPGKLRVVHDAAAKTKGVALNDMLLKGPDLIQSLPGVVMRFRQHAIAVTADIKEMFMQIKLRTEDRDALRYLWRKDRRDDQPPEEYRMTSLIFGASSSPSTAIFIKDLNAKKHEDTHPEATAAIIQKHYVDDYLDSFRSLEDAVRVATDVREIHKKACFELKQWRSNSTQLLEALGETATDEGRTEIYKSEETTERVLGLIWKPEIDELAFNLNLERIPPPLTEGKTPTKREALRIVMSLFDPLGFASPVTIRAKQLLQEVWRRGTEWDEEIDHDLAEHWRNWIAHLQNLRDVAIPRRYLQYSDATSLQLHVFTDASESAYSAVLFWRTVAPNREVNVSLVLAKAKVAPLKLTSIPRLELQAAVMGSRLAEAVIEEHERKPDSKTFWTDSKTVLTWIKTGSRSYKPYVAHRLAALEECTTVNEWRWVPTKLNVADDATRDVPLAFGKHHRWYRGPDFLYEPEDTWPTEQTSATKIEETGEERVHHVIIDKRQKLSEGLPEPSRFSNWDRLRYTTARVLQFIQLCKSRKEAVHYRRSKKKRMTDADWKKSAVKTTAQQPRKQKREKEDEKHLPVTAELLKTAEDLLMRSSQEDSFPQEIEDIKKQKPISKESRLHQLCVEYVNGALRLRSRIAATPHVTEDVRSPKVVDGNHPTVRLWIQSVHRQLHHAGVEATVNECRQRYWILRVRPIARTILRQCLHCRMKAQTPPYPRTGDLPACRLAHHMRPFTYTGVDYFGPITVTVGRSNQKRYVAIFTCLTTRAIHLEIAASLSTSSAIMALRRMISRRGCPTEIWSDNGTNLKSADRELRQAIDEATAEEAAKRTISWRFIPPGAPFMGGAWERMVRSVKTALTATLHERRPTEEVLSTLLAEVEFTVNSRPLTHVSVSPEDPEALTPNHFLLGGPGRVPTPGNFNEKDTITKSSWRAAQRLADIFWTRWMREYLPELQHRREPHGRGPTVRVGDLVQLIDPNLPRNVWVRGRVIATFPGPDDIVRTVDIKTKGGVLRRPVRKLVILPVGNVVPAPGQDATSLHGGRDVQDDATTI